MPARSSELHIDVTIDGSHCTVALGGELDVATYEQLRTALQMICAGGYQLVVVDLGELRFLGLAGLHVLWEVEPILAGAGCRLVLANPDRLTLRVLAITGLDQTFHMAA